MAELSVTRRIANNFSWLLAGNVIAGLLNFLLIVYIARTLRASAFGLFQLAQAFLLYLVLMVDSGLSVLGMREIVRNKGRAAAISLNIFGLRLLLAAVVFSFSAAVLFLLPLEPPVRWLFLATFLIVFFRALNADWVFQGLERMAYISLGKVLYAAAAFLFILVMIKGPDDLLKVPLIQVFCGLAVALGLLFFLFKRILRLDLSVLSPRDWHGYFFLALPLGASALMSLIFDNIDTIMLGLMDRPAVIGYYNAAYRIFYILAGFFFHLAGDGLAGHDQKDQCR